MRLAMFKVVFVVLSLSFSLNTLSEWKKILEEDTISVYSEQEAVGVIPFKAIGIVDANIDIVYQVLIDHKNKHLWSPKLKSVKVHKKLNNNIIYFSEYYKTPWPAVDREFLLKGQITKTKNKVILSARSIEDNTLDNSDYIQARVETLHLELIPVGKSKTKVIFEFFGDFQGWMPIWLTNLIQKKWPLRFIQGLRKRSYSFE
jgi:uncharacterized membrane protein